MNVYGALTVDGAVLMEAGLKGLYRSWEAVRREMSARAKVQKFRRCPVEGRAHDNWPAKCSRAGGSHQTMLPHMRESVRRRVGGRSYFKVGTRRLEVAGMEEGGWIHRKQAPIPRDLHRRAHAARDGMSKTTHGDARRQRLVLHGAHASRGGLAIG